MDEHMINIYFIQMYLSAYDPIFHYTLLNNVRSARPPVVWKK